MGFSPLVNAEDRALMQLPLISIPGFAEKAGAGILSLFESRRDIRDALRLLRDRSYGLGFEVIRVNKTTIVGHSGVLGSYTSALFSDEARGYSVAILCNNFNPNPENYCIQLLSELSGSQ